jgi:hypothetical protein
LATRGERENALLPVPFRFKELKDQVRHHPRGKGLVSFQEPTHHLATSVAGVAHDTDMDGYMLL